MSIKIYVKYVKNNRDFHTTKLNLPTGSLDSNSARILLQMMSELNKETGATILMVTHDAFCASYADRILFLKDGKIFNEILKGEKTRDIFYHEILDVLSLLGGDNPC